MTATESEVEPIQLLGLVYWPDRPRPPRPTASRCSVPGCQLSSYMGKKYCHEHIESMPLAREIAAQLAELERQARLGAAGQLLVLEVAAWIYDRDGDASLRYLEGRAAAMKLPSKDLRLILEQMAKAGMIRIHAGKPKRIELL